MSYDNIDCENCGFKVNDCRCGDTEISCHYRVICPYCAYEAEPDHTLDDYEEGQHERECMSCGKEFLLNVSITHYWQSNRPEDMELKREKRQNEPR